MLASQNNREVLTSHRDREMQKIEVQSLAGNCLQKISSTRRQGEKEVPPYLKPCWQNFLLATPLRSTAKVQELRRELIHPILKAIVVKHGDDRVVFHRVKRFFKVELKNDNVVDVYMWIA